MIVEGSNTEGFFESQKARIDDVCTSGPPHLRPLTADRMKGTSFLVCDNVWSWPYSLVFNILFHVQYLMMIYAA